MSNDSLLDRHVRAFNEGVKSRDFGRMVELFSQNATMAFENIPVGPMEGREEIAAAYSAQPPDDGITILRTRTFTDHTLAEFAWFSSPGRRGGDLEIYEAGGLIDRLVVVYGGPPQRWDEVEASKS